MDSWVKTVFKVIVGTMAVVVLISLIVEYFNTSLYSTQMKGLVDLSLEKACDYFGQETYKDESGNSKGNVNDVIGANGSVAVSGRFYNDMDTAQGIYNSLYSTNEFRSFAQEFSGKWSNLDLIYNGIFNIQSGTQDEQNIAEYYADSMMTALNIGVAYLDRNTIQKIMKWNVVMMLSNGIKENIVNNVSEPYVKYHGFRLYYETIQITSIDYNVYDVLDKHDAKKIEKITNIDVDNLGITDASDERRYICVAGINYSVSVSYSGVTPLQRVIAFVSGTHVEGKDGGVTSIVSDTDSVNDTSTSSTMTGGGLYGNTTTGSQVPGKIIYYIIR